LLWLLLPGRERRCECQRRSPQHAPGCGRCV